MSGASAFRVSGEVTILSSSVCHLICANWCVCAYTNMCVCVYVCICVHLCTIHMPVYIYINAYIIYLYMHTYIPVHFSLSFFLFSLSLSLFFSSPPLHPRLPSFPYLKPLPLSPMNYSLGRGMPVVPRPRDVAAARQRYCHRSWIVY